MDLSIFLARLMGLYFLIVALTLLVFGEKQRHNLREIFSLTGIIALSGYITILFGLSIAISHSIWTPDYRGLITFLGYFAIFQGFFRATFPEKVQLLALKMRRNSFYLVIAVLFILGAYLTYQGFSIAPVM